MRPSSVRVRVISFGPLRSMFTAQGEWRELPEGSSVAGLMAALRAEERVPEGALQGVAVAVNQEYAAAEQTLQNGDEVAILPPVSGGDDSSVVSAETTESSRIQLVSEPIDGAAIERSVKAGADGAMCAFDGIVRDNTRGRATLHLDYEAYAEMALRQMAELRTEAIARFGVREVAIVHRLGRLYVGETSVFIAVGSAHRGAAFDACRWVIDTLKKKVPIWKREQFADGAVWADGEPFPDELRTTEATPESAR